MASKSKARKKTAKKKEQLDLEAIGLVLLALGILVGGLLLPALPTGALGEALREALMGRIGWGAYLLPWPPLVLGGLFLLRKNPPRWPLVLAGYLVISIGLWLLLMLIYPAASGRWGLTLRGALAGATGWLGYPVALLIISLGAELVLAWPPTRIARSVLRRGVDGVRQTYKALLRARNHARERAAFGADVALLRNRLTELDRDLAALSTLYPGSVELDRWRKAVLASRGLLKGADEEVLADVRADTAAWEEALSAFTADRAAELAVSLRAEGIGEFEGWVRGLKAQLDDPIAEPTRSSRPLDDIRKALALDLTALMERYQRLTRERDVAAAALASMRPRELARASQAHHGRSAQYKKVAAGQAGLEQDTDRLEPWRELNADLAGLLGAYPQSEELEDYSQTLTTELQEKGRVVLGQLGGWQQALQAVEGRLRAGYLPEAVILPTDEQDAEEDVGEGLELSSTEAVEPPFDIDDATDATKTTEDEEAAALIGGIPIQIPGYDLLDPPSRGDEDPLAQTREVQGRISKIDETLANFKLQGRVVSSVRGPTVTRFEVEPAPGEKISRFAGLSDDLALALAVGSVRIEAPIPGKSVIGLEVPNASRNLIRFREAAEAASFKRNKARLPLILGKSIDGEMIIADLAKMPHLLIAGSTGSGKSVAVNTLIGSLLYKFLPTDLRFLMIDPKMVELTPFDGIPHLLRPVVTNPNDAAGVLLGAVAHMERRYKMMSKIGAKNLDQYNEKARNLDLPELPFIVIIIDELADLMITSPKEVESAIMRLAQMARATGMHLVLATQRPSVDILTSLIKVNVPARIAFAVSSGHDSRTILDSMGAERLIGSGDMLYYQPGLVKAMRLQGPFISEDEIGSLADFLRRQYFDDDFVEAYGSDFDPPPTDDSSATGMIDWNDDKLREAAELVINEGQASVSRLQRRLSVGHARAGKLMDSLEALGVVGAHVGSKPREVLVALEELPNIFGR